MPTYSPYLPGTNIPGKTFAIWNKDPVNSTTITNFVFQDTVNVTHDITFSSAWAAGAGATWSPGVGYRGNDTLISQTKTYVSHVGDISTATASTNYFKGHTPFTQAYTTASTNKLQVDSTTTVGQLVTIGMAVTGGGYTGQTVSAFSATVGWMVLSAVGPTTLPAVGTTLTFTDPFPPTLKLVSTATLYTGMTIFGNGFTAGQTVVSIGTDSTVVASADPNTGVYADAIVTFKPPAYVLKLNNISGLSAGWTVDPDSGGFVYSVASSIISTSGTEYLIMSGDVGYASPSGAIKFISNQNNMITLGPNTSATWVLYYDANNSVSSNNLPKIIIYAKQNGNTVQKIVNNIASINQTPGISNIVPPDIPSSAGGNHSGSGFNVDVSVQTFTADIDNGFDVASTLVTITVTNDNGVVISVFSYATPAFSYGNLLDGTGETVFSGEAANGLLAFTSDQAAQAIAEATATAIAIDASEAAALANDAAAADAQAQADADAQAQADADGTSTTTTDGDAPDGDAPDSDGANTTCFVKGSKVTLANKTKIAIEDVKIGDQVLGLNGINTVTGYDRPMLIIDKVRLGTVYGINGLEKFVTSEHPILTDNGWKAIDMINAIIFEPHLAKLLIGNLEIGDKILTEHGEYLTINSIEKYEDQPQQELYNLLLDGDHTFYLNELLVHNKGEPPGVSPTGGPVCVVPWALVTMADGSYKEIQFVESGELVQGRQCINTVIVNKAIETSTRIVSFNNIKHFATETHPFMTNKGWGCFNPELLRTGAADYYQQLKNENNGNDLVVIDNTSLLYTFINGKETAIPVENINYQTGQPTIVYRLTVSGDSTFVVENLISHNKW